MTTPSRDGHRADTVAEWQSQLLRHIQQLEFDRTRLATAEYHSGPNATIDPELSAERARTLDGLEAAIEVAEQTAITAGVPPDWVADARELGRRNVTPPVPGPVRQMPERAEGVDEFYLDMLTLDLWHLERMAALEAARRDRMRTGRWSYRQDDATTQQFLDNMRLRCERISALAAAANITPAEADALWGSGGGSERRRQADSLRDYGELELARNWYGYARATSELAIPPYIPTASTAAPADLAPPTPQQMIGAAIDSQRTAFIAAAIDAQPGGIGGAPIDAAVTASLPERTEIWSAGTEAVDHAQLTEPDLSPEF
ncbi:hypothetical protein C5B73_01385 [Nocardia cyriacigeorgica]|nr:hypothetical protein C5B73_01385 [Nocardia cyriacigeorgica]